MLQNTGDKDKNARINRKTGGVLLELDIMKVKTIF